MQQAYVAGKKKGYFQITAVDGSASSFPPIPQGTTYAMIQAEAQAVRWRDDLGTLSTTVGYPLAAGSELRYEADGLTQLRFLQVTAGAILNVTFYG